MVPVGQHYQLPVVRTVDFGVYLKADDTDILLPTRYVPAGVRVGDMVNVFLYHDNEGRVIATTQRPYATVGEIAFLKVVDKNNQGAFLDWGIMKDLFVPLSQQRSRMHLGERYLVMLYIDEQTGRVAATEKFAKHLSNEALSVGLGDVVDILLWQETDIGYKVIVNNRHTGVLHYSDVFANLSYGQKLRGFVKTIREGNKLDILLGEKGYSRVEMERERVLELLKENGGYLPYHDRSQPEEIYKFFGISKKTFKMIIGSLYKEHKVTITQAGIKLAE